MLLPFAGLRAAPVVRDGGVLAFDDKGAKVGEQLPNLTVYTLDGKPVAFHEAWDGVLITASLTCPKSRAKYPDCACPVGPARGQAAGVAPLRDRGAPGSGPVAVQEHHRRHAGEPPGRHPLPPAHDAGRAAEARAEFRKRFDVPSGIEIYVDGMTNDGWRSVGGGPNMGLAIDREGVVPARQGWFDAAALKGGAEAMASPGNDVNRTPPGGGPTMLQEALLYNRGDLAKRLLAAGAKTNLFPSAALGEVEAVRRMLEFDPSLARRRDGRGRSPLDYAAAAGQLDVAKLLLEYGATDQRPPGGGGGGGGAADPLALHWAARYGRSAVAGLLLDEAGSDVRAPRMPPAGRRWTWPKKRPRARGLPPPPPRRRVTC